MSKWNKWLHRATTSDQLGLQCMLYWRPTVIGTILDYAVEVLRVAITSVYPCRICFPGGQKSLYLHSLSCGSQIQQRDWGLNGPRKQCGNLATGRHSNVRANVAFALTVHKGSHFFHWGQSFDMFYTSTLLKQNENAYPLLSISKQSRSSEIILKCDLILNIYSWYSKFSIIQSCKGKIYFSLCRCTTAMVKS